MAKSERKAWLSSLSIEGLLSSQGIHGILKGLRVDSGNTSI
jgi:hypothetical protein